MPPIEGDLSCFSNLGGSYFGVTGGLPGKAKLVLVLWGYLRGMGIFRLPNI
jgi:hypothetical protein